MNRRWALLAVLAGGVAAAAAPASAACILRKLGELPVTMDGLTPTVPANINGVDVRMMADSGAFFSLLTPQAAARIKLKVGGMPIGGPSYVEGLGGVEEAGVARAKDFTILGYTFHNADFIVASPQLAPVDGLIGNNFLSFADVEFDLANGVIRLFKPADCGPNTLLAYWAAQSGQYSSVPMPTAVAPEFKIVVHVRINGHDMRAIVDSGAGRSYVTRNAAKAAGVSIDTAGVRASGVGYAIGRRPVNSWIATFQSFKIGDEEVKNAVLEIGDGVLPDADMLIGADFLLSHRVYIGNSEHKLFFSYIGGPVFNLGQAPSPTSSAQQTGAPAGAAVPGAPTDAPTDAAALSRRGAAFAARRDYADAIADFTRAAALEPGNARRLYDRGMARWESGDAAAARTDFDAALKLDPTDADALMARGEMRLGDKDEAGAASDFSAAIHLAPDDRLVAAYGYAETGHFELAVAEYDQWIAANPKGLAGAAALNGRCWTRASWGQQLDQALADCNAAMKLAPGNAQFLDSRGFVFLRLGQNDKALADYSAALRSNPKQAPSLYGRGVAEVRLGRQSAGEADIAAALALEPSLAAWAKTFDLLPAAAKPAPAPAAGASPRPPG